MRHKDKLSVTISPMSFLYLAIVVGFAIMLWYLSGVVIIVLASMIFAAGLDPSVKRLQKMKFPRWLAVSLIYILVFAVIGYLIFIVAPTISNQITDIYKNFPSYKQKIDSSLSSQPLLQEAFNRTVSAAKSKPEVLANQASQAATSVLGSVFGFITFLVLTFYFLMSGEEILDAMVRYVPGKARRRELLEIGKESSVKLGHWIRFQLIMSFIVFITTFLILYFLGIKVALSLALFAGLLQIVPFIGAFVGAIPAVLAGLVISPVTALIIIVLIVLVQLVISNVVAPQMFKKAIGVSPVIILLAALVGFTLLGPIGVILAIPVAAIVDVVFDTMGSDYVKEKIDEVANS
jgi:predicted PurR-regulated permease PerM